MMKGTTARQRGLTFANFLLTAILLVFLAIGGMKIIPAYVEDRTIHGILDTIAHDPEMQGATPADIHISFDKRAMMNNITVVNSNDIVIQKTPNGMVLSVNYNVKIGLVGNASLLLEFETSSSSMR
ncbi:MAG TPA: DUF4845 domain-containing protein [Gallionellaceae bacterium]|nr:DUF4845 domain-containing protein [Gallionellaceae bacterium]